MRAHYVNRLAEALAAYQQENGLTGIELPQLLGVTDTAIFTLMRGHAFPARETVRRVAEVLRWTLDEIGTFLFGLPPEPLAYLEAEPDERPGSRRYRIEAVEGAGGAHAAPDVGGDRLRAADDLRPHPRVPPGGDQGADQDREIFRVDS